MVTKSVSPDEWRRPNAFDQNLQESATTIIITVFFTSNGIGIVSLADKQGPTQTHTNTTFWPNCSLVESQVFPAEPPIAEQRHYHLHWAQTRTHTVYTHQKKKKQKAREHWRISTTTTAALGRLGGNYADRSDNSGGGETTTGRLWKMVCVRGDDVSYTSTRIKLCGATRTAQVVCENGVLPWLTSSSTIGALRRYRASDWLRRGQRPF